MKSKLYPPKASYSTSESAHYIGVAKSDLDKSRVSGDLSGMTPPPFIRIGRRVRYRVSDLDAWLSAIEAHITIAAEVA